MASQGKEFSHFMQSNCTINCKNILISKYLELNLKNSKYILFTDLMFLFVV